MKKIIMTLIFAALISTTTNAATGKTPNAMDKIKQHAATASQSMQGFSHKVANSSAGKAAGNMGKSALNSLKGLGKSANGAVSNLRNKKA